MDGGRRRRTRDHAAQGQDRHVWRGLADRLRAVPSSGARGWRDPVRAGGAGDGRSLAAIYALGAQGVQVGTLFLSAEECPIPDSYKERLINAIDTDTIVTGRKAKDPVRSLKNPMLLKFAELEEANAPHEELEKLTLGSLSRAVYDGDMETGSAMAGEIAGMIKNIRPAKQIIEELFNEAEKKAASLKISY